jgi:O-antigen/teichoic acid export membrane protein
VIGFLGQILAARWLGVERYGLLAIVLSVTGFVSLVFDLTVEEAVIKYGFRYVAAEEWGKLRRLFSRALRVKFLGCAIAGVVIAALAPAAHALFGHSSLVAPFLIAALLPIATAPEGLAGNALLLRTRYDIRSFFLVVSMVTRFVALVVGSRLGVTQTVLFIVLAQVVTTAAISAVGAAAFRRFPIRPAEPLGADRKEIISFIKQSAIASTVATFQGSVAPIVLGMVTNPVQVGLYRAALAPQSAFAAISSPIRLILLTEQTRDWEHGNIRNVFAGVRRFTIVGTLMMVVALPPLIIFMPALIKLVYSAKYAAAGDASRFVLVSAALMFVFGWSKSLPVSIGRPGLRVLTHGLQAVALIPLTGAFGALWQATGAAAALAVSSGVFVAAWIVLIVRLNREHRHVPVPEPSAGGAA